MGIHEAVDTSDSLETQYAYIQTLLATEFRQKNKKSGLSQEFLIINLRTRKMAVPTPGDIVIAIMGITGAGKSTFIANATGQYVRIGDSLSSCQ